ncbi:MAG: HTH-type transcriptional repressor FabR [Pseudomonadota bacterium]
MDSGTTQTGRKASINRLDIIKAAISLVGPQRSIASLSLREVARQAQIAPNSFYRHFKDTDALAIAVIEEAGSSLRAIVRQARQLISERKSVVRSSVESFMNQLDEDPNYLPILLREGTVGSDAFQLAVRKQLHFFEQELQHDLELHNNQYQEKPIKNPKLVARAITRLVFAMGADALNMPHEERKKLIDDVIFMVKTILRGAV